jgi:Fe-S-cluster-containing dehydrogenase component
MTNQSRRAFLKCLGLAGTASAVAVAGFASEGAINDNGVGLLYDATRCVGCKACVAACKRANDLPPEKGAFDPEGIWDAPADLDGKTRNIVKLYRESESVWSYVKVQCMHCIKPSCVSVCPVSAMQQDADGRVFYDKTRCIGCRMCMVACPFIVPRFQWEKALPQIVKCDLCKFSEVPRKGNPACASVCPTGAVQYGRRRQLLAEAKRRIERNPGRYQRDVYGEHEVGGTNVLYLASAAVSFDKLGLPKLPYEAPAAFSEKIQHRIYKGFIAPLAIYATLFFIAVGNRKKLAKKGEKEEGR